MTVNILQSLTISTAPPSSPVSWLPLYLCLSHAGSVLLRKKESRSTGLQHRFRHPSHFSIWTRALFHRHSLARRVGITKRGRIGQKHTHTSSKRLFYSFWYHLSLSFSLSLSHIPNNGEESGKWKREKKKKAERIRKFLVCHREQYNRCKGLQERELAFLLESLVRYDIDTMADIEKPERNVYTDTAVDIWPEERRTSETWHSSQSAMSSPVELQKK